LNCQPPAAKKECERIVGAERRRSAVTLAPCAVGLHRGRVKRGRADDIGGEQATWPAHASRAAQHLDNRLLGQVEEQALGDPQRPCLRIEAGTEQR
jgi:hypothetical protein